MPAKKNRLHLISVIDDEIDESEKFKTVVKSAADKAVAPVDPSLVNLLNSMARMKTARGFGVDFLIRKELELMEMYRREADKAMGKEVVDLILDSRSKVHLLIDSVGGSQIAGTPYVSLMERAADTVAYVAREASSLACNMMLEADRSYCLKDSYILWHLGRNDQAFEGEDESDKREMEELQREDDDEKWEQFTAMMDDRCREEKRDELKKKLDASAGLERREVVFSGGELADYGIVNDAFDTTRQLMEKFCKETGIETGQAQGAPGIGQYFNLALMSETVSRLAKINCSMMKDHDSGRLRFRIVDDNDDTPGNRLKIRALICAMIIKAHEQGTDE